MPEDREEQPTLAGLTVPVATPPRQSGAPERDRATVDPVAEVVVDSHLAHLDRPFEYAVPADLDTVARAGVRVRVRFAGRAVDGFLLARKAEAEHPGRLAPLLKVVSDEVVLTPHLAQLCRGVADHYGGTMAAVLRLAIPPRHARAEKALSVAAAPGSAAPSASTRRTTATSPTCAASPRADAPSVAVTGPGAPEAWGPYPAGAALLRRLAAGDSPAAAWTAVPDAGAPSGWPAALACAVAAVHASGRGSVVVLPDHRDIDRAAAALDLALGPDSYVRLTADLGPEQRYTAWLRALRGHARVVLGSRSAAFAPVHDLGLVAWWDDGDDNLQEPRAPYPHVREILRRRAELCGAGLLVGGYARTPQVQQWIDHDRLPVVRASSTELAARTPRVVVAGEGHQGARDAAASAARLPSVAWRAVKDGLLTGPVLVQVPRRGYLVALSCDHCRTPVRCATCAGPLQVRSGNAVPTCGWCGRADGGQPCRECGSTQRRSRIVGEERTAEEIGRAFPGARVIVSRAGQVLGSVPDQPAVVVATPGAEPVATGGYAAALLLDGWALLDRGGLDSGVEALRRWTAAAALTIPGAPVVLAGVPPHAGLPAVEALVRWDAAWLAARELQDREALGLPPVRRTATVTGEAQAVTEAADDLTAAAEEAGVEVLGPLPVAAARGEGTLLRLVVREQLPRASATLPRLLRDLRAARSLRKQAGELIVRLDPPDLDL
ncbi:primosome assembly protein PriA [Ornithinimicrobium cavernae]|uniref:primosomal protein N' family DNA-binding protein n=1 Tax=Ornithinimicrobium cavernae TaxID=2666047 RepID=UPI0012B1701C|nr:primosome assembly protein PriA [Ornithinimicrobium cavernae]